MPHVGIRPGVVVPGYGRRDRQLAVVGKRGRKLGNEAGKYFGGRVDPIVPGIERRVELLASLFERALAFIRETDPAPEAITVNSSRYAVPVYGQFGFAPTGPEQVKSGLRFTPMRLELPADAAD